MAPVASPVLCRGGGVIKLGEPTTDPCPHCAKPLRVNGRLVSCPDQVHCQYQALRILHKGRRAA